MLFEESGRRAKMLQNPGMWLFTHTQGNAQRIDSVDSAGLVGGGALNLVVITTRYNVNAIEQQG